MTGLDYEDSKKWVTTRVTPANNKEQETLQGG